MLSELVVIDTIENTDGPITTSDTDNTIDIRGVEQVAEQRCPMRIRTSQVPDGVL